MSPMLKEAKTHNPSGPTGCPVFKPRVAVSAAAQTQATQDKVDFLSNARTMCLLLKVSVSNGNEFIGVN